MAEVGELVAERVHETRILEGLSGGDVAESNPDRPVREADAVASLDIGSLRLEHAIAQPETRTDTLGIGFQPRHQLRFL
jgi:hypothetical protein